MHACQVAADCALLHDAYRVELANPEHAHTLLPIPDLGHTSALCYYYDAVQCPMFLRRLQLQMMLTHPPCCQLLLAG